MNIQLGSFGHSIIGLLADGLVVNPKSRAIGAYSAELAALFAEGQTREVEILSAIALNPIAKMTEGSNGDYANGTYAIKFDCKIVVAEKEFSTKLHACDLVAFTMGNKSFTAQGGTIGEGTNAKPWLLLRNAKPATIAEVLETLNAIKV
jgi:hypothetical protein